MIRTIILSAGIIAALPALGQAQETADLALPHPVHTPQSEKKHEIGVFHNSTISSNSNNDLIMMGVQYKNWVKPNKAYRTLVSHAQYSIRDMRPSNKPANNDTIYQVFSHTTVNMAFIGAGVEMQRHFYKKVYLFAALELRGGAGRGSVEEALLTQRKEPNSNYYSTLDMAPISTSNVSAAYVGFVPSIGGKFQFNKVSFGAEITPIELAYKSVTTNGVRNGVMDFNLGTFSNRFFFSFRF